MILNKVKMQNQVRNSEKVEFELEMLEGTLEMTNEGLNVENELMVSIDLDGDKIEGTFNEVYEILCTLLEEKEINFIVAPEKSEKELEELEKKIKKFTALKNVIVKAKRAEECESVKMLNMKIRQCEDKMKQLK